MTDTPEPVDHRAEALANLDAVQYHFDEGLNGAARATAALTHATLAVADAVRALAAAHAAMNADVAVCPHGSTGLCMYCLRDFTAGRS